MDENLKTLLGVVTSVAQGKGVQLSPEKALELAQKGAELLGALVGDHGWKEARAAGAAERAKIQTEDDAERELRGENNKS